MIDSISDNTYYRLSQLTSQIIADLYMLYFVLLKWDMQSNNYKCLVPLRNIEFV